jgi:hypothetical protein
MGHLTYPNATHTRFAHSLGVLGIMTRITDAIGKDHFRLRKHDVENLRLAALLHDIGHYPYSHLMEMVDSVVLTEEALEPKSTGSIIDKSEDGYPNHEEFGRLIVEGQRDVRDAIGGRDRAVEIGEIFSRTSASNLQLSKLIHSTLDMDRMDYLIRDGRAAGVPFGEIDSNYLLNNIRISPDGMVGVDEKALAAAEHFLMARFFMHRAVYYHKTTYGFEEACRQLLRRARNDGLYGIPRNGTDIKAMATDPKRLATFTDAFVDSVIQKAAAEPKQSLMRDLATCIQTRRPPKMLWETTVLIEKGGRNADETLFYERCKAHIPGLARRFRLKPGHFLVCSPKPIEFEKRGPLVPAAQMHKEPSETRDELIKVFMKNGGPEPKSMVDIPHSIVGCFARMRLQMFRLYVVPAQRTTPVDIAKMAEAVRKTFGA